MNHVNGLQEDILLICYTEIAPDSSAEIRLGVIAAIGRLLDVNQAQEIKMEVLASNPQTRVLLQNWLKCKAAKQFWRFENGKVITIRKCQKHALIGTIQLFKDLDEVINKSNSVQIEDLNTLWIAANQFVDRRILHAD